MLTHRDLKAIQEGNRRHPDVMALLREVKRLRDLAAFTYSILGYMPVNWIPKEHESAIEELFNALHDEPAVIEYNRMRKKREQLEFRRQQAMELRSCADASAKNRTIPNGSK